MLLIFINIIANYLPIGFYINAIVQPYIFLRKSVEEMRISQRLFDLFPNIGIRNDDVLKKLNRVGDIMGRPMQNRLIMGGTAILSQPYIDEHNKRVDKDTARAARNRTIGKIIAGTTVGCIVRLGVYKLVSMTTDKDISVDRWDNALTPRSSSKLPAHLSKNRMRNYRTALATILASIVMLSTNVLFDMPLTNKISNFLNKYDSKRKQKHNEQINNAQVIIKPASDNIRTKFDLLNKGGSR